MAKLVFSNREEGAQIEDGCVYRLGEGGWEHLLCLIRGHSLI